MEYCQDGRYKVYRPPVWVATGKYRAKSGKYVAVMHTESLTAAEKADLYNNKASNLLWVNSTQEADTLSSSPCGIPKSQMIIGIDGTSNMTPLVQAGLKRFNLDEPAHNGVQPATVDAIESSVPSEGRLYMSEYKLYGTTDGVSSLINAYAPSLTSKSKLGTHTKWESLDGYGTITDPRPQWTQLRDALASSGKFDHGVLRTIKGVFYAFGHSIELASAEEMQLIWGHANNLGVSTMFIFVEGSDLAYYSNVLDNALNAGFQVGGWLERQEEEIQAVYCCSGTTYDPDSCSLLEILHPGNFRWV